MKEAKAWIPAVQRLCTALGTVLQVQAGQQRHTSRVPGGGNQLSALRALEVVQWAVIACLVTAQQQKLNISQVQVWYQLGTNLLPTYNLWTSFPEHAATTNVQSLQIFTQHYQK